MIVDVIDIFGVVVGEPKDDTPIRPYGDRPPSFTLALECMQPETWQIHVVKGCRSVECGQYVSQFVSVLRIDATRVIVYKELSQAFVTNRPYHDLP